MVSTSPFSITPLMSHIGARIEGLDLSQPIDAATAERLQKALVENLVLVFGGQNLSEDDQIRFAAMFGPLSQHFRPDALRNDGKPATNPAVMMITNERENGKPVGYLPDGEIYFHTDSCFTEMPQRAVCLYALELPSTGGDTIFASACRLLDTLPENLRARLSGRTAVNCYEFGVTIKQVEKFDRTKWPHFRHPAIARDERDGRDYLYVNELMTEEVEGLSATENRETLDAIFDHIRDSPDSYWHLWQPGDLVLWDNRRALHARVDFPADEPRKLRRVPVADDRPVKMAAEKP
jgi:taurine dioxygenase